MGDELADVVYSDPPWGPGLLRWFYTHAKIDCQATWGSFLAAFRAADEIGPLTTAQVFEHAARLAPSAPMRSSAELCLAEARELLAGGDEKSARARAVYSLKYSVGILSPLYQAAIK
jgi:hypothetical protein